MKTHHSFFAALFALLFTLPFSAFGGKYATAITTFWNNVDNGHFDEAGAQLSADLQVILPLSHTPLNRDAYRQLGEGFRMGFPDISHKVLEVIEGKMTAAVRGLFSGTNTGSLMGNPPTGNRVELPFLQYWTFDETGKAVRIEISFDLAAFNAQLMKGLSVSAAMAEANVRAMLKAADAGDGDTFMSYWSANGVNYFAGKHTSGEDMKKRILGFKEGFPNITRNIEEVIVSENHVFVRGHVTGTNTGMFRGQAPTGKSIDIPWLGLYKLNASGKIESGWVEFDTNELDKQRYGNAQESMAIVNTKQNIRSAYDALNRHDWNAFAALCDADKYTDINVAPVPMVGVKQALEGYKQFFDAFSNMKIAVTEIGVISPTRYLVKVTLSGKHTGNFMGVPATGKMMNYDDCDIVEVDAQGKIILHQPLKGGGEVFRQIGVNPEAGVSDRK